MMGRTKPIRLNTSAQARCWRCGVDFSPFAEHVFVSSPCRDCRVTLRAEGDMTVWDTRTKTPRVIGPKYGSKGHAA